MAPLAIISAVRNGEMPARMLSAIPTGATSATDTIAPGPTVEIEQAIRKMIGGTSAWRPRAKRSSRRASTATVPLTSARVKRIVTPVERDEERGRKPGQDGVGRPARIQADNPRHRNRQQADVDARRAADRDDEQQRAD